MLFYCKMNMAHIDSSVNCLFGPLDINIESTIGLFLYVAFNFINHL